VKESIRREHYYQTCWGTICPPTLATLMNLILLRMVLVLSGLAAAAETCFAPLEFTSLLSSFREHEQFF
jgi:hypothetical protein